MTGTNLVDPTECRHRIHSWQIATRHGLPITRIMCPYALSTLRLSFIGFYCNLIERLTEHEESLGGHSAQIATCSSERGT